MFQRMLLGVFVGFGLVRGLAGCGQGAVLECRVAAVRMLPPVPEQVSFADVADLVQRLHACEVPAAGDAGR